tara:strand:+ start:1583 stop:1747 length:165 start_codon:yes stop_codon:yes gene_type:complete
MKKDYFKMTKEQLILVIGNTTNKRLKMRLIRILTLKSLNLIDDEGNLKFDPPEK